MHAAIWIDGEVKEDQIVGTAPRAEHCRTRGEKLWRRFVLKVQRHDCRPKCFMGGLNDREDGDSATCKYGYPRERCFLRRRSSTRLRNASSTAANSTRTSASALTSPYGCSLLVR